MYHDKRLPFELASHARSFVAPALPRVLEESHRRWTHVYHLKGDTTRIQKHNNNYIVLVIIILPDDIATKAKTRVAFSKKLIIL